MVGRSPETAFLEFFPTCTVQLQHSFHGGPRLWNLLSICWLSVQTEKRHNSGCSVRLISGTLNQLRPTSFALRYDGRGRGRGWSGSRERKE